MMIPYQRRGKQKRQDGSTFSTATGNTLLNYYDGDGRDYVETVNIVQKSLQREPSIAPKRQRQCGKKVISVWAAIISMFVGTMFIIHQQASTTARLPSNLDTFWLPNLKNKMSTFQPVRDSLPTVTIDGINFPRGLAERSYMGTGLWNSRLSLPRALMAMFGSQSAYIETPVFTVCRLQLQHGTDREGFMEAVRREIFQTTDQRRDRMGYHRFVREYESVLNCTPPEGTQLDDLEATRTAKTIVDERFQNMSQLGELARSRVKALNPIGIDEPNDLLYTTTYAHVAAQYYGPSVVVMNPDGRGLDLGYYGATQRKKTGGPITSCSEFPEEDPADAGEIITPGYKFPDSVAGFEIRRAGAVSDRMHVRGYLPTRNKDSEVPSISHAFYKESLPEGTAVFLLHFTPGRVHCAIPTNASDQQGSFFECNHGGREATGDQCVASKDDGDYSRPLRTTGFLFDEEFQGGCGSATRVLKDLPPVHQDYNNSRYLYSQMFRNVVSTVSTEIGKDMFIAHFASPDGEVECNKVFSEKGASSKLWQIHRKVATLHAGLDTQYSTCAAHLPLLWSNGGVDWNTSVVSLTQLNPLDSELFAVSETESSSLSGGPPNWLRLLGFNERKEGSCNGFKGSLCEVELVAHSPLEAVTTTCRLECTYTGAWFASLHDPLKCQRFSRDLLTPVVHGRDSNSMFIGTPHRRTNETNTGGLHLSQADLDPLHWPQQYRGYLNVIMSSDIHGYIHGDCDGSFCSSGARSFASVLDTIRISSSISRNPTLVLDAGDVLFGSSVPPRDIITAMNVLGYDAMALGNHDLDIGVAALHDLAEYAMFPILAANVNVDGMPSLSRTLMKNMTIGGVIHRVCVIGLSTPEPNPLAGKNLTFTHSAATIHAELTINQEKFKCDIQILLSHLGFKEDKAIAAASGPGAVDSPFLSLIIGGHSHLRLGSGISKTKIENGDTILDEPFPYWNSGVPIAHVGSNCMNSGILSIQPKAESDSALRFEIRGSLQPLGVSHGIFPDMKVPLPQAQGTDLGGIEQIQIESRPDLFSVCSTSCRRKECLTGNLVTNSMRDCVLNGPCGRVRRAEYPLIALLESGTLRGCLRQTKDDLSRMLPWPNQLVVITVKGSTILAMLEHGLNTKAYLQGGGFLQTSGLHYKYRGNKVLEAWLVNSTSEFVNHRPSSDHIVVFDSGMYSDHVQKKQVLGHNVLYNIIVSDWLASGGDSFGPILRHDVLATENMNITLQEAVYYYSSKRPIIQAEMRSWDVDSSVSSRESIQLSLAALAGSLAGSVLSFPLYSCSVRKAASMDSQGKTIGHLWNGALLAAMTGTLSNGIFFTIFFHTNFFHRSFLRAVFAGIVNGESFNLRITTTKFLQYILTIICSHYYKSDMGRGNTSATKHTEINNSSNWQENYRT